MQPTKNGFRIEKEVELIMLGHDVLGVKEKEGKFPPKGHSRLPHKQDAVLAALDRDDIEEVDGALQLTCDLGWLEDIAGRLIDQYQELRKEEDRGNYLENPSLGYAKLSRYISLLREMQGDVVADVVQRYQLEPFDTTQ